MSTALDWRDAGAIVPSHLPNRAEFGRGHRLHRRDRDVIICIGALKGRHRFTVVGCTGTVIQAGKIVVTQRRAEG